MSRHRKDPLRPLTAEEHMELSRLSRSHSAPAAQVDRARALLAIADGASYTAAARLVGRGHNETISAWVSRFNREGLAAVQPHHGGGPRIRYGADAQQRILAEWARPPQREQDGTATWSLSLLQKALRRAPDGLPKISTFTIWRTLHEAGLSWQKSRTWCETGVALRRRKPGVMRVSDPDAPVKKS
jgi:transposase